MENDEHVVYRVSLKIIKWLTLENQPCHGSTALMGIGHLYEFPRSLSDKTHTVGLLWMNDRPVVRDL